MKSKEIGESDMEKTGERYLPEFDGDWTLEHTHRYLLAGELAEGKDVLDAACGDGYGAYTLAGTARTVTGVDICPETVDRARNKYRRSNLSFVQGSVLSLPLADNSVDLVVSFETIEHLAEHEAMLDEFRRVLRPGGMLAVSTPDKPVYAGLLPEPNQYHVKELHRHEFVELLQSRFHNVHLLGQRVAFGSVIGAEGPQATESFLSWRKGEPDSRRVGLVDAVYLIALAGDGPLPALPSSFMKAMLERSDYARDLAERLWETAERNTALAERLWETAERNTALAEREQELQRRLTALEAERDALEIRVRAEENALRGVYASRSWRLTAPLRGLAALFRL